MLYNELVCLHRKLHFYFFVILIYSFNASALSASTYNSIYGTPPYFTFDGGLTKITNSSDLLTITLSDGRKYLQTNSSSQQNPIELPVAGQTMADILMVIPANTAPASSTNPTQRILFNDLIKSPNNYWGDDDGDGQGTDGISATGSIAVTMRDSKLNRIARNARLDICNSPYRVVIGATAGTLVTQYGIPNTTNLTTSLATYYIKPKVDVPYVCFAQPNLNNSYDGYSSSVWDPANGFKLQDINQPSNNFPTTGSEGLFFYITVIGATASDVIANTSLPTGSVSAKLSVDSTNPNKLKIVLTGPNVDNQVAFTPTTFTLSAPTSTGGRVDVYSFKISKWFITEEDTRYDSYGAKDYCARFSSIGFHLPKVSDYTNQFLNNFVPGTSVGGNYTRAISGALFSEWGVTSNEYYVDSRWLENLYWTSDASGSDQYAVYSYTGYSSINDKTSNGRNVACMSP